MSRLRSLAPTARSGGEAGSRIARKPNRRNARLGGFLAILFCLVGLAILPVSNAYAQVPESEPNNDTATANGPFTGDQTLTGSISPQDDADFFRIVVTTAAGYRFSTPDDDGGQGCAIRAEDPFLRLYDSTGMQIGADDDGGPGFCSELVASLQPGTYFVSVTSCCPGGSEIPDYVLAIDEGVETTQCSDGIDNDSDGLTNFPEDQGCENAEDDSEDPAAPECSDGLDNDSDGKTNFPADQGCENAQDDSEGPDAPQCSDRLDNDSDGQTNFPDDQGCDDAQDNTESPDAPRCSDRLDNDSDGKRNFPDDPGCSSASDNSESPDPATPPPPANPCTIKGTSGNDIIRGTSGDDVICAGDGNDIVYGGGGNDTIYGGRGNDILRGEGGNDRLYGGPGADVLRGGAGRDLLAGGGGNDQLIGGAGNDRLVGGAGSDVLSGQDGADSLTTRDGVEGNDVANGGAGEDSCETDRGDTRSSC